MDNIRKQFEEICVARGLKNFLFKDSEGNYQVHSIAMHYEFYRHGRKNALEEAARVCEAIYTDPEGNNGYDAYYTRPYLECAEAIRALDD